MNIHLFNRRDIKLPILRAVQQSLCELCLFILLCGYDQKHDSLTSEQQSASHFGTEQPLLSKRTKKPLLKILVETYHEEAQNEDI
jgi:hypothetical protein